MRRAKRVVHKNIAERSHLAGQRFLVFLLAGIHAAVLQHDDLPGLHGHAVRPVRDQRDLALHQLAQALGDRRQRVSGLESAFSGTAQVRSHHHRSAGVQRHLQAGHRSADARVFGDAAVVVLRHVQVGADENALTGGPAVCAKIRKTDEVHGESRRQKSAKKFEKQLQTAGL